MSNFEPSAWRSPNDDVSLDTEMDEDWCAALREAYGPGTHRSIMQSCFFYTEERLSDVPCTRHNRQGRHLERVITDAQDSDGILMDGRFHGARLLPHKVEEEDGDCYFEYLPYAILSDVTTIPENEDQDPLVVTDDNEFIFVPIKHSGYSLPLRPDEGL